MKSSIFATLALALFVTYAWGWTYCAAPAKEAAVTIDPVKVSAAYVCDYESGRTVIPGQI